MEIYFICLSPPLVTTSGLTAVLQSAAEFHLSAGGAQHAPQAPFVRRRAAFRGRGRFADLASTLRDIIFRVINYSVQNRVFKRVALFRTTGDTDRVSAIQSHLPRILLVGDGVRPTHEGAGGWTGPGRGMEGAA